MSAIDVLNPKRGFDQALGFNANWNYGTGRAANANVQFQRPRLGPWNSRITANYGYKFPLQFIERPAAQVDYLMDFYTKFGGDGFTLVDYDKGGRHHVGCFTAPPQETHLANGKYNIAVTFEDLPGAAMLDYPSDFDKWGHDLYIVDSKMNLRVSGGGPINIWTPQLMPRTPATTSVTIDGTVYSQPSTMVPSNYGFFCDETTAEGPGPQISYVGWGFKWVFSVIHYGTCHIYFDDVMVVSDLDLSTGLAGFTLGGATIVLEDTVSEQLCTVTMTDVPLGEHRVKLVPRTIPGRDSGLTGMVFPPLRYIY